MNRRQFAAALAAGTMTLVPQTAWAQAPNRPQTPQPPFPYAVEEVSVASSVDGVSLAGTLTLPHNASHSPAVLLLGVAGPNDRDLAFADHAAFAVIADRLARSGFVVLRLDDRGVGGSGGDWAQTSYDVLAADALSAVALLRGRQEIDPVRVGIIGLSEGSAIAAMTAARAPEEVAFAVLASPPALGGEASLRAQFEATLTLYGVSGDRAGPYRDGFEQFLSLVRAAPGDAGALTRLEEFLAGPGRQLVPPYGFVPREPSAQARLFAGAWYQSQLVFDPSAYFPAIRAPILVIGGARDLILPPSQHHAALRTLRPDAEFVVIDGVSHLLQPSATGAPSEYAQTEMTIDPRVLDVMDNWLRRAARL